VRHITPARLDTIEPLLTSLRTIDGLVERSRGVFYRRSRAFLHFHEHGDDEVYADVRFDGDDFTRLRATTKAEQRALVSRVQATVRESASRR
jgi:hypothetical protein